MAAKRKKAKRRPVTPAAAALIRSIQGVGAQSKATGYMLGGRNEDGSPRAKRKTKRAWTSPAVHDPTRSYRA